MTSHFGTLLSAHDTYSKIHGKSIALKLFQAKELEICQGLRLQFCNFLQAGETSQTLQLRANLVLPYSAHTRHKAKKMSLFGETHEYRHEKVFLHLTRSCAL